MPTTFGEPLPDPDPPGRPAPVTVTFVRHVLLVMLVAVVALIAWRLVDLIFVVFGATLLAIGLRSAATSLARTLHLTDGVGLAIVVLAAFATLGGIFWFFGSVIASQADEVVRQAPLGLDTLSERVQSHPLGRFVMDHVRDVDPGGVTRQAAAVAAAIAGSVARGVGYAVIMVLTAIYLAARPDRYRRLLLGLIAPARRDDVARVMDRARDALRRWLVGQLVVMLTIGTLSSIGLWLLGIDAAIALGISGGLLCFIPYVGAVLAAVPAVLVASTQGPGYALSVVLMYVAVHFLEGNFITPLVQAEATALPPVLSLISVVAFSALVGPSAVLTAVPFTVVLLVVLDEFHSRRWPNDRNGAP